MDYEQGEVDFLKYLRVRWQTMGDSFWSSPKSFPTFPRLQGRLSGTDKGILREPQGTPFYRAFRNPPGSAEASSGTGPTAGLLTAIVEDFNVTLADANFGMGFFDGSAFKKELDFTGEERDYANWLTIPNTVRKVSRGYSNDDLGVGAERQNDQ